MENQLNSEFYFPSGVYTIKKPEYLISVKDVAEEYLQKIDKVSAELYPVKMTENFYGDERISSFITFIGSTSWNILESQGIKTDGLNTVFDEFWCQEHFKHSGMDEHIHGNGAQIVGFYFLDTPENSSRVVFHDPRPGKKQINLPENDVTQVSYTSSMINFKPEPGLLIFTNSWLPHSFTRHGSDDPIRFIHFTLSVKYSVVAKTTPAEVI